MQTTDSIVHSPTPVIAYVPVNMEARYPPHVELQALAMTAEYCAVHSVTDPLRVRQVHCLALSIVMEDADR